MEKDLNDLDLIDRYLNNELDEQQQKTFKQRYLSDPEFKIEVEVYRKIYEGIKQLAQEDELKPMLDSYYTEYMQQDLTIAKPVHKEVAVKPIRNWRNIGFMLTGIAATICFLVIVVSNYYHKDDADAIKQNRNAKKIVTHPKGKIKDTALSKPIPQNADIKKKPKKSTVPVSPMNEKVQDAPDMDGSYAMTGQKNLPPTAIRTGSYPQPLKYTFNAGVLTIYGDPLLGLFRLSIFKDGSQYYMRYADKVYKLNKTNTQRPLEVFTGKYHEGEVTSTEEVRVYLAPFQTMVAPAGQLDVVITNESRVKSYFFSKKNNKDALVIQADFKPADCIVVKLKKDGKEGWYLVYRQSVYFLDPNDIKPTGLKALSPLASSEARLFIKKEVVTKSVFM